MQLARSVKSYVYLGNMRIISSVCCLLSLPIASKVLKLTMKQKCSGLLMAVEQGKCMANVFSMLIQSTTFNLNIQKWNSIHP